MNAFRRLDHLLCDVPDIDASFKLFHDRLGFPVAWPIGAYWPGGRMCGIALGGINLELIQLDTEPVAEARIRSIAFEPTAEIGETLTTEGIPYETFEKVESNDELLRLRGLPAGQGPQLLCVNTIPQESALEFPLFACKYALAIRDKLSVERITRQPEEPPVGSTLGRGPFEDWVEEVVIGHPNPRLLEDQLTRLGLEQGVPLRFEEHPAKEVTKIKMRSGSFDIGSFPARFLFL